MPRYDNVAILGVGLLGGSIGFALRQRGLAGKVVGIGRNPDKLARAVEAGIVDHGTTDLAEGVKAAEMAVVCTPIETVATSVAQILQQAPADCLVTDVASTKDAIVREVHAISKDDAASRFVGSHPLAGDHRSGAEFARADLFQDRTVVVTPSDQTPAEAADRVRDFWQAVGANVVTLTPDEHDAALAMTSHLPHAVASALAACTSEKILPLAATGWSDTTRIAAADPALWRQIFLSNRQQVLAAIDHYHQRLAELRSAIEARDANQLEQMLAEGKRIRDAVGN